MSMLTYSCHLHPLKTDLTAAVGRPQKFETRPRWDDAKNARVPFVEDDDAVFLKTIIPSRKATKPYLGKEADDHEE